MNKGRVMDSEDGVSHTVHMRSACKRNEDEEAKAKTGKPLRELFVPLCLYILRMYMYTSCILRLNLAGHDLTEYMLKFHGSPCSATWRERRRQLLPPEMHGGGRRRRGCE